MRRQAEKWRRHEKKYNRYQRYKFIIVMYSAGAIYYCADVLGDYALYTPVNNALSIAQFATMFFTPFFMKKFGAKAAISFIYNWLPVGMIVVTFIIMLTYKLDKELPKIQKELEERHK